MQTTHIAQNDLTSYAQVEVRKLDPFHVVPRQEMVDEALDRVHDVAADIGLYITQTDVQTRRGPLFHIATVSVSNR